MDKDTRQALIQYLTEKDLMITTRTPEEWQDYLDAMSKTLGFQGWRVGQSLHRLRNQILSLLPRI